ncbi:MAG: MupG family TIM beta-alpha barrel fold protein [Erysipelotrichaceae bacterium]|nr:MupG family TIM beta-alpha barrel fold protein [Erysipelotrichaceae bacterium]
MHKLGISVYPDKSDINEVYAYMEKAASLGFTRIFTCFLSVPDDERETYLSTTFKDFMKKAHELGFEVAADTNPEVFKLIGATPDNLKPFADLGLDIIRLDGNFGTQGDIAVTRNPYNIKIEFNASMDAGVELLINNGGNKDQIIMCHNFFPERYTGLDFDLFQEFNAYWKELNLHTAAFVSSNNEHTIGPWQVFCGLPTVEIMRGLPIDLQARYLLATGDVDDILVGNYPATDEELEALSKVNLQAIEFRVDEAEGITDNEKAIMYEFAPHWDRYDHSSFMLRSSMSRVWFKAQKSVQDPTVSTNMNYQITSQSIPYRDPGKSVFTKGDVLVVNDNLAHYRGELEIVLTEIPNDGERNLVATVKPEEIMLLDFIKPGHHFKILK